MLAGAKRSLLRVSTLRLSPAPMTRRLVGVGAMGVVVLLWWLATTGLHSEERLISRVILPSPAEVVRSFPSLWRDRALLESIAATLKRVLIGFGLAAGNCGPPGVAGRSWRGVHAAGAPHALFGRHLPAAALRPPTILWFW